MRKANEKNLVQDAVIRKLKTLMITNDVLWYLRVPAGRLGGYTLAQAGTPDIVAVVNQRDGNIAVLFLECKAPGRKKLDYEQEAFFDNMASKPKIICRLINDPDQLYRFIREAQTA